jgi:hypothetical protein
MNPLWFWEDTTGDYATVLRWSWSTHSCESTSIWWLKE